MHLPPGRGKDGMGVESMSMVDVIQAVDMNRLIVKRLLRTCLEWNYGSCRGRDSHSDSCSVFFTSVTNDESTTPILLVRPTMRPWLSSRISTVL
jgi:hypothetical protein